ncbi:MAG TPA: 3-deoxy-manno-octulosonate cytidylyltransferase [Flavobacteriales bacterium]|nr:3-deoxy-manno-octulosonate cytidylyltransferase [Flavobacteriales bacterium]HQV75627.1 3-deoxy-manno-octulosonate cytidylyltransferase [Flavobacteriales bacterium]HQW41426.1 3-deoxy-manno-octulosonate cytidylyltransferase [Flavobacteriales bacterium]
MRILGIIPARFASTRLPGKALADIGGKSMVQLVIEQALQAEALADLVTATDDQRIFDHVVSLGAKAVMTDHQHPSGTDRCYEALERVGLENFDAVVNIQGDEPFIVPQQIDELCNTLRSALGGIATLAQRITEDHDLDDPGEVKIATDADMTALYFSRAAIPFLREGGAAERHKAFPYLKHVGLYAYRSGILQQIVQLPPSSLEQAEGLEQLRWLQYGFKVRVGITEHLSFCVDTPADLEEARRRVG